MCYSCPGVRGQSAALWRLFPLYYCSPGRKIGGDPAWGQGSGSRVGGRQDFEVCQNQLLQALGDDRSVCHWVLVTETRWGSLRKSNWTINGSEVRMIMCCCMSEAKPHGKTVLRSRS